MGSLRVYSRQVCHLCEALIEPLLRLMCGKLEIDVPDTDAGEELAAE